ncbi:MAG: hypothetical protein SFT91_05605 [Rickettsiaceae bacterium]|nr:hypothetical protein [Rickettsiaceae bacterium]
MSKEDEQSKSNISSEKIKNTIGYLGFLMDSFQYVSLSEITDDKFETIKISVSTFAAGFAALFTSPALAVVIPAMLDKDQRKDLIESPEMWELMLSKSGNMATFLKNNAEFVSAVASRGVTKSGDDQSVRSITQDVIQNDLVPLLKSLPKTRPADVKEVSALIAGVVKYSSSTEIKTEKQVAEKIGLVAKNPSFKKVFLTDENIQHFANIVLSSANIASKAREGREGEKSEIKQGDRAIEILSNPENSAGSKSLIESSLKVIREDDTLTDAVIDLATSDHARRLLQPSKRKKALQDSDDDINPSKEADLIKSDVTKLLSDVKEIANKESIKANITSKPEELRILSEITSAETLTFVKSKGLADIPKDMTETIEKAGAKSISAVARNPESLEYAKKIANHHTTKRKIKSGGHLVESLIGDEGKLLIRDLADDPKLVSFAADKLNGVIPVDFFRKMKIVNLKTLNGEKVEEAFNYFKANERSILDFAAIYDASQNPSRAAKEIVDRSREAFEAMTQEAERKAKNTVKDVARAIDGDAGKAVQEVVRKVTGSVEDIIPKETGRAIKEATREIIRPIEKEVPKFVDRIAKDVAREVVNPIKEGALKPAISFVEREIARGGADIAREAEHTVNKAIKDVKKELSHVEREVERGAKKLGKDIKKLFGGRRH